MKIGYLINTYPVTSGTFIRREIHALEAQGAEVARYAVRRWDQALVDPADRAEAARTQYLLSGRKAGLVTGFLGELVRNPGGMVRALGLWRRLVANAGGGLVRHVAYLMEAAVLRRLTARDGVGHLHCHFSTNPAAVAMLAHAMGGPTYSFTAHGPDEFLDTGAASLGLKIDKAAFVVAISHFCRGTLALAAELAGVRGAWDKIHIVRCGLDLGDFPVSGAGFDTPEIVCVGRLCPQKGQVLIPAAVAEVARAHPGIRVVLIGDGDSRGAIEAEIARLGLETQIELAGWATNAEVRERVGRARALLLPSFAEGLPIVIMEALALGRPVITTYIAGIPELVDAGCGWILPAGDEAALARALGEVMAASPEKLAEMGREGRTRVEAQHDQNANAALLKTFFDKTAGAAGAVGQPGQGPL
ncbi:glycosyltransferase family 4 protein [Rhodobacteraceae bacterium NNCM2]|nr:glycosyltransferase family 4 protein [Coraliihabitans acroporae]